jgi:hypothetical protein
MGRPPKEFQAFATLTGRLLAVPRAELDRRLREHCEAPRVGAKRGPKPTATRPTAS